jgi:hypothetical protein
MSNYTNKDVSSPACPIYRQHLSEQFTAPVVEPVDCPIEKDSFGVWHIRGYEQAQAVLRVQIVYVKLAFRLKCWTSYQTI